MQAWLIYSIISLLLWGVWGVILKYSNNFYNTVTTYYLSTIGSFATATILTLTMKNDFNTNPLRHIHFPLIAGFFGTLGYWFMVKALEQGKASIVITITAVYPVITLALSILILYEKLTLTQVIGIVLAVLGIVLMSI
ncbi:EamA family transporter [Thermosphaera sp.]|uniref:EamA family transporter n=1 Tax=Thermosphaera aggregans TaxID=54254 RepID=A0A7C2BLP1_9CREN